MWGRSIHWLLRRNITVGGLSLESRLSRLLPSLHLSTIFRLSRLFLKLFLSTHLLCMLLLALGLLLLGLLLLTQYFLLVLVFLLSLAFYLLLPFKVCLPLFSLLPFSFFSFLLQTLYFLLLLIHDLLLSELLMLKSCCMPLRSCKRGVYDHRTGAKNATARTMSILYLCLDMTMEVVEFRNQARMSVRERWVFHKALWRRVTKRSCTTPR